MEIEVLLAAWNVLGEGPLWDAAEQRLYRIDCLAPAIQSCTADGGDVRR
jgi:L-arabinonolactonase